MLDMKQILLLLIIINCHMIQGVFEWTITGKVTDFGQNVTLFCHVPNCCPKDAGWDRWTPVQQTLFIDVKTGRPNKKYDGKVFKDGYTLVIQNLTKEDLNVSYSCIYGVTFGHSQFLLEEDVFTDKSDTTPNDRLSKIQIAGIILGITVTVAAAVVVFVIFNRKKRNKQPTNEEGMAFLEIGCKEHAENIDMVIGTTESDPVQLNEDKRQKFIHELMLKGECGKLPFAKLVFIGKNGVGKTSLMRRLLGQNKEDFNYTQRTDEIEVEKCNINIKDGKWSQCDEISEDLTNLIQEVYRQEAITVERSASYKNMHQEHFKSTTDETRFVSDGDMATFDEQKKQGFCRLWEYAAQKSSYSFHQVCLSNFAVYLLVTDSLKSTTTDDIGNDIEDFRQYASFWFDVIHCYYSTTKRHELDPPIIVVCTKEDEFTEPSERQKRRSIFKEDLKNVLKDRIQRKHLRNVYCVSNTKDLDTVFDEIRKDISRQVMNMKGLGKVCPLKWFEFQKVLVKLMDSGVPISTTTQLFNIAKHEDIGITNDEEFKLCLQYCHDNGTVIYFEDDNLKDYVILDTKWLDDAFRCLIFDNTEPLSNVSEHVRILTETEELTESIIYDLFTKEPKLKCFSEPKHLLEVMKRFDIIVNFKNSPALYVPCLMKSCTFEKFRKQIFDSRQFFYKTSWLCLQFQFLPPDFFSHILAWYIKQYSVSMFLEMKALYRQIGVFDLDSAGWEKLVVCEGPNVIALQVWNSRDDCQKYGNLRKDFIEFVNTLRHCYRLKLKFIKTFKCKEGDFKSKRQNLDDLTSERYKCLAHEALHLSNHLVEPWELRTELMLIRQEQKKRLEERLLCRHEERSGRITDSYREIIKNLGLNKEEEEEWMNEMMMFHQLPRGIESD